MTRAARLRRTGALAIVVLGGWGLGVDVVSAQEPWAEGATASAREATSPVAEVPSRSSGAPTLALHVDDFEEILVDLRVGRLARLTARALSDGADILLPVAEFLALAEVDHRVEPDGYVHAVLHPGARRLTFGPGATSRGLVDGGVFYTPTGVLAAALGVTFQIDWIQLAVVVMDPESLPVGRRVAREARWRALRGEDAVDAAHALELGQSPLGGGVLDWSLAAEARDPEATASYAAGAGLRALGGSLQASARSIGPASLGEHHVDLTYLKVWPDRLGWTQMRLGDAFTTGSRVRSVRGASFTNAPYLRRSFFGTDAFRGRVGPGWDVEVRQNGQTLDLTRADEQGAFALDIPLRYGENSVQVVAFGPHGEVVTTDRLFLLGSERIPSGAVEWGLSGGACRDARCDFTGNADLAIGVTSRWTVRTGAELFERAEAARLLQPYAGVTGLLLPSLEFSSEFVHDGFARAGLTYAPSSRFRVRSVHTVFASGVPDPILHDSRRTSTTEADALIRPLAAHPRWFVRGAFLRQDFVFGRLESVQASSVLQVGHLGFEAGVRRQVDAPVLGVRRTSDFQVGAITGLFTVPGDHKVWLRGEVETLAGTVLHRARGQVGYQLTPGTRLEVGSAWRKGMGGEFTVTLSADLAAMRTSTQWVAPEGGAGRLTQVAQGTMQWDEASRSFEWSPGPGLERGGISGYVFLDENGNGVRDPGEPGLDGVRVVIAGRTVRTDAEGRHRMWDLVPFERVRVWADSGSIADPTLVPVRDQVEVRVPPASFGRVDIAVTPSQELWGRVVRVTEAGEIVVPHAELELVDRANGSVRALRAFSDGEFYESGVKPGRYLLRVVDGSLTGLGLAPEVEAMEVEVAAGAAPLSAGGLVVRLVRISDPGGGVR